MIKILSIFITSVFLIGCKADDPSPVTPEPTPIALKGVYIINEGNFNSSNSTLSFYVPDSSKIYSDVFFSANGRNLGDVANDLVIYNAKAFIAVNNSHKIEVISTDTHKSLGTMSFPSKSSYKIAVYSDSKGYVTNFKQKSVSVFNPTTYSILKDSIPVGNDPTGILVSNKKIYVCNSGGLTPDSTLTVIDPATDKVIKTIVVGVGPNEIAVDSEGEIVVLCSGKYNEIPSKVYTINPIIDSVVNVMTIPMSTFGNIYKFAVSSKGYGFLPSFASIAKFDTKTNSITSNDYIHKSVYGIAIDNVTENIYIGDPLDYASNGKLFVFNKNGAVKDSSTVGINPGTIVFRR